MAEFEAGGHYYRTEKMNARDQLHLLRGLGPLFAPMARIALLGDDLSQDQTVRRIQFATPFFEAFSQMSKTQVDEIVNRCFSVTRRRESGGNGTSQYGPPIFGGARDQYDDIDIGSLMTICWEVIQENLGGFFAIAPASENATTPLSPLNEMAKFP